MSVALVSAQKTQDLGDNKAMNESNDSENQPVEQAQPTPVPSVPLPDPRRRLRELLSIPESVRTDPQWDEIIELEVQLAPGNRIGQEGQGGQGGGKRPQGHPNNPSNNKGGGGGNFKRHGPGRKFPPKPKKPAVT